MDDSAGLPDLGAPASYLILEEGTPVYSSDGEKLGKVEHVLADATVDVFDGLVIDKSVLPGDEKFIDAAHVDRIYERGVVVKLDAAGAEKLPEPGKSAAAMGLTSDDFVEEEWDDEVESKLKRAWDFLSGKRPE